MDYLPLTEAHHKLVATVKISAKTKDRMIEAIEKLYPKKDPEEYFVDLIHENLSQKLVRLAKETFKPNRKYKVEISRAPVPSLSKELNTTWSLPAYMYLSNPEQAKIGEVVSRTLFSKDIGHDELAETLSGKVFKPHFDYKFLSLMPVQENGMALMYLTRVE